MKKNESEKYILECLKKYNTEHIFDPCDLEHIFIAEFERGEYVTRAGVKPAYLYIFLSGCAQVLPLSKDGKQALLDYLNAGEVCGDLELLLNLAEIKKSYYDVKMFKPGKVIAIPSSYVQQVLTSRAQFLLYICTKTMEKLDVSSRGLSKSLVYDAKSRTLGYIDECRRAAKGDVITFKPTEIALKLGISYRHMCRILDELVSEGMVQKVPGGLKVLKQTDGFINFKL